MPIKAERESVIKMTIVSIDLGGHFLVVCEFGMKHG